MLLKYIALALIALATFTEIEASRKRRKTIRSPSNSRKNSKTTKVDNSRFNFSNLISNKDVKSKYKKVNNNVKVKTEKNTKNTAVNNNKAPLANNIANSKVAAASNRNNVIAQNHGVASGNALSGSQTVQNSITLNNGNSQDMFF